MFEEYDEDLHLSHKERMLKELHLRRTEQELNINLVNNLKKLRNNFQDE